PTRDQAKTIYWEDLKALLPRQLRARPVSETKLCIYVWNRYGTISELHVLGMDRPERVEGSPWDWGLLDEYGNMKPETWGAHVRPALSDRNGSCSFIGVPEGRNHYYDLVKNAEANEMVDKHGNRLWRTFHWLSEDILDDEEIIQAKMDLDELTYEQEYCGSFVVFSGLAYYKFNSHVHVSGCKKHYDPQSPLIFCFDFNVAPGTASILQEMTGDAWPISQRQLVGHTITSQIGEVFIHRNSNTEKVCDKLIQDYGEHQGLVFIYGDATGGAGGSAKVKGSDWDLVKQKLYPVFGNRLSFKVKKSNPRERARINAVNSRLMNMLGDIHFQVDNTCIHTIKDLEGVKILEGSVGEIDKKSDSMLSHLTDGIGYYIHREYPVIRLETSVGSNFWK
ncbi:MAG: hypothetical protein LC687_07870, partial [Actinobacteria bacterium]|nr:hypothetical protein [Actinomycetota bacterium]